jgi:predicted glycosyltransferase
MKDLLDDIDKWISEKDRDKISNATNIERFFYLHLVYGTVLFVAINEMVHELYAKEIEHKNAVFNICER